MFPSFTVFFSGFCFSSEQQSKRINVGLMLLLLSAITHQIRSVYKKNKPVSSSESSHTLRLKLVFSSLENSTTTASYVSTDLPPGGEITRMKSISLCHILVLQHKCQQQTTASSQPADIPGNTGIGTHLSMETPG